MIFRIKLKLKSKVKNNFIFFIILFQLIFLITAWASWMDDQKIHEKVLQEKGWIDGTIQPIENILSSEVLQQLIEDSRDAGIFDGILICDYNVIWAPFGRWVTNCEGGWYVTFYGDIYPKL